MASYDPVKASVRDVMRDISYFEGYDLPASPPETPPMNCEAQMSLTKRTPMHANLERVFPKTPPQTPRNELKRKFSNNVKTAFNNVLPSTPPASPPTRLGMHSTLARTVSDTINKGHQISIFTLKSRPTIVTIDMTDESQKSSLRRSSSYSLESAGSASKDPLDRVRDYSARSIEGRYPSDSPCGPPAYSPPPNTPANAYAPPTNRTMGAQQQGITQIGAGDNDAYNPFSYTGPTQYPNHSLYRAPTQSSNRLWQGTYSAQYPNLPSPGAFEAPGSRFGVADLEKARRGELAVAPEKKRHCKRTALILCVGAVIVLVLGIVAVIIVIWRLRHHYKHHHRRDIACIDVPGMYRNGEWQDGYQNCT